MCGILAIFNANQYSSHFKENFSQGKIRGPDNSSLQRYFDNVILGFHRLSINGINEISNQPIKINNKVLICNGEIYNHKELFCILNIEPKTNSDCEVIIHLYEKYGMEHCLQMLDGVFAFVLLDHTNNCAYAGRDMVGVRPLYLYKENTMFFFTSELKTINKHITCSNIKQFPNGSYVKIQNLCDKSKLSFINKYTQLPFSYERLNLSVTENTFDVNNILENIKSLLVNAVKKRCENSDQEVCCLLSGGLDSSLVSSIASNEMKKQGKTLKTFSIGLQNSTDLKHAKDVAIFIGSDHTEVIVSEEEFFNSIPETIQHIESYDTTTVRASVGNYLIAKHIRNYTNCKVVLNGDGADELTGGYLYFSKCNDCFEFDKECKRLLEDIKYFDVLRSDKSISSNGLEPRTPFLDRSLVQYYLSISPLLRSHVHCNAIEKYLFRLAFDTGTWLPKNVLWRRKEAFSDGVSGYEKSWSDIIKEKVNNLPSDTLDTINQEYASHQFSTSMTIEQKYYRYLFDICYPFCAHTIPYYWMPRFVNANDSSARSLSIYWEGGNLGSP